VRHGSGGERTTDAAHASFSLGRRVHSRVRYAHDRWMPSSSSSSSSSSSTSPGNGSPSSTYPAGKQQVCQARDQLKASVKALATPALLVQGTDAIKAAVDKVRSDLQAVKAAAKTDYTPEVDALQTSLQDLQTSLGNLGNGSGTRNLQAVATDIGNVGTSAQALFSKLDASCS
jgi:hypothetical protein